MSSREELEHVGLAELDVADIVRAGVRFAGPDLRAELHAPVELGGALHLWTLPETSAGQVIQLIQV